MDKSEKKTIVEQGTSFKGSLASSCPIDVRGKIEGDVETPSLTVSKSGAVHGRAKVGSVRSEGELSGEFDADSVELAGRVLDNTIIRARSFEVKLSMQRGKMQAVFGLCELAIGDEPTEHVAEEAPVAAATPPAIEETLSIPQPPPFMPPPENQVLPPAMHAEALPPPLPFPEPLPPPLPIEAQPPPLPVPAEPPAPPPPVAAGTLDDLLAELDVGAAPEGKDGKKKKKKDEKNGETGGERGWSSPPSQPPPAS